MKVQCLRRNPTTVDVQASFVGVSIISLTVRGLKPAKDLAALVVSNSDGRSPLAVFVSLRGHSQCPSDISIFKIFLPPPLPNGNVRTKNVHSAIYVH